MLKRRKIMDAEKVGKGLLYLLASDLFLKFLECLCKNSSDINCIIYKKKVDFRLVLTI